MAVYCGMLVLTLLFATAAVAFPETSALLFQKSGRIVQFKQKNLFLFLSFCPLFLVSAPRFYVGVDYDGYVRIYNSLILQENVHTEWGFRLLNRFAYVVFGDVQPIFVICAAFTLGLICIAIYRESPDPVLSLFLFVTMGYYFSAFNIMRQYLAIALVFFGLKWIRENRFLPFLLAVLAGMAFHKTVVLMLPFFFLLRIRWKQSYLLLITLFGLALYPFQDIISNFVINRFYPQYAGSDVITVLSSFEIVYYLALLGGLLLLAQLCGRRFLEDPTNRILFNCAFYSFVIYLCFSFIPEINRIAIYFEIFVILLIPRIIAAMPKWKERVLFRILFYIGFTLFFIVTIYFMGRYDVLPYQTVFSRS